MKLKKYRRLAVAVVGAGILALVAGPATAHQQNGNPLGPTDPVDGRHDVIVESGGVEKTVSLVRSKVDGCASNTAEYTPPAPACATPSIIDVSAPQFNGTPNHPITLLLCNSKRAAATDQGGDNDPTGGCDFANGKGLEDPPAAVAGSGTFALDVNGDLTGGVGNVPANGKIPLTLTSCNGNATSGVAGLGLADGLTPLGASETCQNANATTTCPPTQGQISQGWTCIATIAEFSGLTPGDHVGFRQLNLKSPIPAKLCDLPPTNGVFVACGATIPAGQPVRLDGVRFPCKTIQPDDPVVVGNQAACQVAHTNKTILIKRNSTGLLEGPAIVPTSQTAGLNGDYQITFNFPNVAFDGELYKVVPHAQDCVFSQGSAGFAPPNNWRVKSCESGKFNAAGPSVKQ